MNNQEQGINSQFMSHPIIQAVQTYMKIADWNLNWRQYQTGQLGCCLTFDMNHASYKTFFDVDIARNFFSVTAYAPLSIPEYARPSIAELLTRINYELFLSKFEMDFNDGELRIISTTCVEGSHLSQRMIKIMENNALDDLDHYFPAIISVVNEGLCAEKALNKLAQKPEDLLCLQFEDDCTLEI